MFLASGFLACVFLVGLWCVLSVILSGVDGTCTLPALLPFDSAVRLWCRVFVDCACDEASDVTSCVCGERARRVDCRYARMRWAGGLRCGRLIRYRIWWPPAPHCCDCSSSFIKRIVTSQNTSPSSRPTDTRHLETHPAKSEEIQVPRKTTRTHTRDGTR